LDPLFNLIIFFGLIIISRVITEKALKELNTEEKARLIDAFSSYRIYNFIAVAIILVLYFIALKYFTDMQLVSLTYIGVIFLLLLVLSWIAFKKMKQLQMPDKYIKKYLLSLAIKFVGFGFLLIQSLTMDF
jgi:hypothetical protein